MKTKQETNWKKKSDFSRANRESNLELYRIIVMLLIVAHHYVVNSGLTSETGPIYSDWSSWRSIFLLLFGAWGKTGINCFVLITGYFMTESKITAKKYVKLLAEVLFYNILIYLIFCVSGYQSFGLVSFLETAFPVVSIAHNFTSCFLIFYLFIPFLSILVHNLNEKQHICLLLLCTFLYVFLGTVPLFDVTMNYVSWFIVLYFMASYLRLYPKKIYENINLWLILTIICVTLLSLSVIACSYIGEKIGKQAAYAFASDSNTFLAVATGISSFLLFKNLKIRSSRFINTVAASTYGVLLIHAHSDTMRTWLWKDVLNNVEAYYSSLMIVHAIGSVILIFIICTMLDFLRISLLEKPILRAWDKNQEKISLFFHKIESRFFNLFHIE